MKNIIITTVVMFVVVTLQFCSKTDKATETTAQITVITPALQPNLPTTVFSYVTAYPAHIQIALNANDNTPADNAITNDGATLGRVLFYDKQLSKNNTVACASCHKQNIAFDDNVALSTGFAGGLTTRNSMSLLNIRFYRSGRMFWDERAITAEKQALQPIQDHTEMGLTLAELEAKVKALNYYPTLFQKAFGSTTVDSVKIAKALAQFERSIVTYQAKYDRVKQGLENFTAAEAAGEVLFNTAGPTPGGGPALSCQSCHTSPMFINSAAPPFALLDPLDAGINGQNRFKSGSLRNISTRTALFHNGRIANVQAMLTAGAPGSGTQNIPAHSVAAQDVQNLLAFMTTLTDHTIATEVKFSNPFQ
jgi:cytochrome c peroxidase